MAPQKCRGRKKIRDEAACSLPSDLLLEIVARTDFFTLVRCAALCKHLRRDILSPPFIRRVTQQVAPCILALLCIYDEKPLTLVHPVTPAAASFCQHQLPPFMSRNAGEEVLGLYYPMASRGGLVLLNTMKPAKYKGPFDLCVYDPMTGHHTFLSKPPNIKGSICNVHKYVLLTAVDGIDCSFMLLSAVFNRSTINVHTATSSSSTWGPITCVKHHDTMCWSISHQNDPVVLRGGVIHWLTYTGDQIVIYDVRRGTPGRVNLPVTRDNARQLHLAMSPGKNLLKLLAIDEFKISMWLQLPTTLEGGSGGGGGGWALEIVIDIKEKLQLLYPDIPTGVGPDELVEFERSGKRNGDVVLLEVKRKQGCIVLDLETKEMHIQKESSSSLLLEIDLPSHLQSMKAIP